MRGVSNKHCLLTFFILVDLWEIFFRFRVGGMEKDAKKSSENDQFTFFLISIDQTVKLVKIVK